MFLPAWPTIALISLAYSIARAHFVIQPHEVSSRSAISNSVGDLLCRKVVLLLNKSFEAALGCSRWEMNQMTHLRSSHQGSWCHLSPQSMNSQEASASCLLWNDGCFRATTWTFGKRSGPIRAQSSNFYHCSSMDWMPFYWFGSHFPFLNCCDFYWLVGAKQLRFCSTVVSLKYFGTCDLNRSQMFSSS